jgi:hypothetical protein
MDDLILVYDKNNNEAGDFALDLFNTSKKWIGLGVQEPRPTERTNFTVNGQNIGIIVTKDVFKSEFVLEALDLVIGAKKPLILIHDIASKCVVSAECAAIADNADQMKVICVGWCIKCFLDPIFPA